MQRRGRGGQLRLPLTATMNASTRRRYPAGTSPPGGSVRVLAILASITIFVVLGVFLRFVPSKASLASTSKGAKAACPHGQERMWHGGHPAEDRPGSCWCGGDEYCMGMKSMCGLCGEKILGSLPRLEALLTLAKRRKAPSFGKAKEETGIVISSEQAKSAMKLIGVYSDPRRDNRRAIVSHTRLELKSGADHPKAGDDAKEVVSVPLVEVGVKYKGGDWYADHLSILLDFKEQQMGSAKREGELYGDVARSTCSLA
ncbi:LOW QUALITY PROTEIN: hypothetical protein ACHAXT_006428 [Thalassiosira profunda]